MSEGIADVIEPVPGEPPKKPKGDLGVRTVSAVVMVAVTLLAFTVGRHLAGGLPLLIFIGFILLGLLWEFWGLVRRLKSTAFARLAWALFGIGYFGLAVFTLLLLLGFFGNAWMLVVGGVIATDVGAYFAGRTIGGPKIAPSISPSKTWAGLAGGMACASLTFALADRYAEGLDFTTYGPLPAFVVGALLAVIAQVGDFFESWLKRRAGVKDSGSLIPGHGGLLDRTDGLIAVLFVMGLLFSGPRVIGI